MQGLSLILCSALSLMLMSEVSAASPSAPQPLSPSASHPLGAFVFQPSILSSLQPISSSGGARKAAGLRLKAVASAPSLGKELRQDFPILQRVVYEDKPLIYLDSAATSQKPRQVLEVMDNFYKKTNANVHRGAHRLSVEATDMYEAARDKIANFVNASRDEIVFTSAATEAVNLVAYSWGMNSLKEGDEIIISVMEHHANIVPWQMVAKKTGAVLKFVKMGADGGLDLEDFRAKLSENTKLVAVVHVSNTLGCINPVKQITQEAHAVGAKVLIDGCQSVPHMKVDVKDLDCDWLIASGHKMCAPSGSGFLYGKLDVLREMPPFQGGGEMIDEVFLEYSTYAEPPGRFEAGTPAIAECVGLGAACDYLEEIGMDRIEQYEHYMTKVLFEALEPIESINIYGPEPKADGSGRAALAAFNHRSIQASDLATFLDMEGVAIRSGHHCTQPLHRILDVSGSCRASCYLYTTEEEVMEFAEHLKSTIQMFDNIESSFEID